MENERLRFLTPSEVEVRLQSDKPDKDGNKKYLLYMDARAARRLLNERFGIYGWQLLYETVNGQLFAKLGIKDPETGEWIWKMETGSESNIEAEKGQVSDALKRAVVTLGWDELYSSPDIRFNGYSTGNRVKTIEYDDNRRIIRLVIVDRFGKVVFNWTADQQPVQAPKQAHTAPPQPQHAHTHTEGKTAPEKTNRTILFEFAKSEEQAMKDIGLYTEDICKFYEFYLKKADTWQGKFDPQALWMKWTKRKSA